MDLHTSLIYVGAVVVSAAVILLVSMFGIKEKSYEEAIAEQRKLPDDRLLMGKKEKGKEKKHKNKTGKKAKEKREDKDEKDEKIEHSTAVHFEETPVILSPEPTMTEIGKNAKRKNKIEKIKPILVNKDDSSPIIAVEPTEPGDPAAEVNHFERVQPKDSLELIRSQSVERASLQHSEPMINKSPKETPSKTKKASKEPARKKEDAKEATVAPQQQQIPKEFSKEPKETVKETVGAVSTPVVSGLPSTASVATSVAKEVREPQPQAPPKETKKGKRKNDILAQIGGDRDGINVSLLMPLVQKAELSRSEIQILIDQLLNKQQDNPSEHSEWTEGRTDPVIKLKKQLAEKEKALSEEHETSATFQNKVKELRAELNSEKSRSSSQIKQLEEALSAKITEAQTLHTRMQHILESHAAEKQGFARQIEQLQAKVNEDSVIIHKMQEDQGQTQGQMQQELIAQRKQLEVQFGQMRENKNALKGQLAQKHIEVQELQNVNMNMRQELQATCESSTAEIEMLRQQLGMMQDQFMHSEGQLQHFKEAGERMQDMARQLEESHRAHADFDHRLKSAHRHEQDLQKQVHSLQAELKMAKSEAAEITSLRAAICEKDEQLAFFRSEGVKLSSVLHDERVETTRVRSDLSKAQEDLGEQRRENENVLQQLNKATSKITKLEHEISTVNQSPVNENESLQNGNGKSSDDQLRITRLQEENDRLSAQLGKFAELEKELKQLREENESLASQLAASTERPAAEGRENGVEDKLLEHTNLLEQKESQLDALKLELNNKESELVQIRALVENLQSQMEKRDGAVKRLENDLEAQRSKNNELRTKNWKVMEALSAAESRSKVPTGKSIDESLEKARVEEQEFTKSLLQRIFPDVKVSEKSYERWLAAFEARIDVVPKESQKLGAPEDAEDLEKENRSLRGMVSQYEQIIDDTGTLKKLESHIETEESRWTSQLLQKENEVANLRIELKELQENVASNETLGQKISELEARLAEAENLREKSEARITALGNSSDPSLKGACCGPSEFSESERGHEEHNKRSRLEEQAAKFGSVIENRLANKDAASQIRNQVSRLNTEARGGESVSEQSTINGPATSDSPKSEGGSGKK